MAETRKKWSWRRWRRRWNERGAALALRWRIWFDRHVLSQEKRRAWRRRWNRRTRRIGRAVEDTGYKVLPTRPEAVPNTPWTRLGKWIDDFIDGSYPPELRREHGRAFRHWWHEFTEPFRHGNARVGHWLGDTALPALTPVGFKKTFFNLKGLGAALLLGGLVCAVIFWLVPGWRSHNEFKWSARARLLWNRGYQLMAYQSAVRALQYNETNEEALRVLAEMSERQGLPDAMVWRRKVAEAAQSPTNQLAWAATALRFEPAPYPTASRLLGGISGAATNTALFHAVAAQFEAKNGRWAEAEKQYLAAQTLEPANMDVQLALALLRLQSRDPVKMAQGEAALASLSEQSSTAIRALRSLVTLAVARGKLEAARDYSQRILANEAASFDDRLVHLDVLTRKCDPGCAAFQRVFQEQVSANPVYVAQLGSWMTAHKQSREARQWFSRLPAAIQRSDVVRLAKADTYAADADWQGLEQFLLQEPTQAVDRTWGGIEFMRQALLARAYRGQGNNRAFEDNFGRAKELASGMAQRLTRLTRLVVNWGWDAEVDDLLWTMFEKFPAETWAADSLLKRYRERDDTDGIRRVFALQLKRSPQDSLLKNNLAMVLLLQRMDLPTAHQLAWESHEQNPGAAVNTSTYAFSLLLQGKPLEGRKLMEALGTNVLKVPSIAAYYTLITAATGDNQTARHYLEFARQADLLPEEKALLDSIRP